MRKFAAVYFLALAVSCSAQDTLKVLFLGNSYTGVNNLPQLFQDLSVSGGKDVLKNAYTPGGYWLEYHLTNSISLSMITRADWDYVILQEQSQLPTIEFYRENSMYPSARQLDSLIHDNGSNTCFYMTWGRKYGGQQTIGGYSSPVFADFFEMQASLSAAYSGIAYELDAALAPVGNAWETAVTWNPDINLWQEDNSHPTLQGSYLTACVFFATLFDESPIGLPFDAGLNPDTALFLQQAADETVLAIREMESQPFPPLELLGHYPNPFNAVTVISFHLTVPSPVKLDIYDILGRHMISLIDKPMLSGYHSLSWNGADQSDLPVGSGIYYYSLRVGDQHRSGKMLYLK